jgi:TolB-like protein
VWDTTAMLPTRDEAIGQVDRVLASEVFASTSRLSRFLRFVAERALAGESERLKEYVIGLEVFDRDERYDPRVDSIVRVEAGRLRTKLEQYYQGAGRDDAIVIRMQKGSYAPSFERRIGAPAAPTARALSADSLPSPAAPASPHAPAAPAADAAAAPTRRRTVAAAVAAAAALALLAALTSELWLPPVVPNAIAVLPFEPYAGGPEDRVLATRLTEGVTAELVRAGQFAVVPSRSAREVDRRGSMQNVARRLGASSLLEARLVHDGAQLRVEARLVDAARNAKIWVETFYGDPAELDELSRRIAAGAVAARPDGATRDR